MPIVINHRAAALGTRVLAVAPARWHLIRRRVASVLAVAIWRRTAIDGLRLLAFGALALFAFTAVAQAVQPTVTDVSPNSGSTEGGAPATITGTNFGNVTTVWIGGVGAAFVVVDDQTISVTTPSHAAGAVDVVVINDLDETGGNGVPLYTFVAPPTVNSISPNLGSTAGNTSVTISGAGFTGATSVTIGGGSAALTVQSDNEITTTTTAHAAGSVDVVVSISGVEGTGTGLFTYVVPPTITSVSPVLGRPQAAPRSPSPAQTSPG